MSDDTAQEQRKLKKLVSYSRDVLVVVLDKNVIHKLVPRELAKIFTKYHDSLVRAIKKDSSAITSNIDSNNYSTNLMSAGLSGDQLNFKYSFFNGILNMVGLPSLDEYGEADIYEETSKSVTSVLERLRRTVTKNVVRLPFRKWLDAIFDSINNLLDSIGSALHGLGEAMKEIKHCLEIGKKVAESRRGKSSKGK